MTEKVASKVPKPNFRAPTAAISSQIGAFSPGLEALVTLLISSHLHALFSQQFILVGFLLYQLSSVSCFLCQVGFHFCVQGSFRSIIVPACCLNI